MSAVGQVWDRKFMRNASSKYQNLCFTPSFQILFSLESEESYKNISLLPLKTLGEKSSVAEKR